MKTKRFFSVLIFAFSLSTTSQALAAPQVPTAPLTCAFRTYNGHFLTAVGGGGRTVDVIHSDAVAVRAWEKFTLIDTREGGSITRYGIRTMTGHYLTAVGGGGRVTDVIHSDATRLLDWEKFTFISLGSGYYAIRTINGHYLTAVDGGGRITDVLHSDATQIRAWERYRVYCGL